MLKLIQHDNLLSFKKLNKFKVVLAWTEVFFFFPQVFKELQVSRQQNSARFLGTFVFEACMYLSYTAL
jgi:hypothetical protein